jgi:hypothetical protein
MIVFMANQIELKAKISIEDGQELYKAYFINPKGKIYEKYRSGVDTILQTDGYGDCIIADPQPATQA